jgi:signal transduction histidine kinase
MRIVTKIWLSLAILLCGQAVAVVTNDGLTRSNELFLKRAEEDIVPAMIAAQGASTAFKQLFQDYQDAVVFGEGAALERTRPVIDAIAADLGKATAASSLETALREAATSHLAAVRAFTHDAEPTYRALAASSPDAGLPARAAQLKARFEALSADLDRFTGQVRAALTGAMLARNADSAWARTTSETVQTAFLLAAFALFISMLLGWAKRLTALLEASNRMAAGDYSTAIAITGGDEVSTLAYGFSQMQDSIQKRNRELQEFNARLESQVLERTRELERKNDDLEQQIAERQRIAHSLRLLEVAVAQLEEGVVITAPDAALAARPAYLNPGFLAMFARPPGDALDGGLGALFPGGALPAQLSEACARARDGGSQTTETVVALADRGECFIECHVAPIRDGGGVVTNLVAIMRDLTERKAQDAQRQQGAKLESIGQLAAGVAHEINTPIQFIGDNLRFLSDSFADLARVMQAKRGLVERCRADALHGELIAAVDAAARSADVDYLRGEVPKAIAQALEGVTRVAEIVIAMKEFSHPDEREKAPADLTKAILTTLTVARSEYKYLADVVTEFAEDLPLVPCLVGEFNQVILNLVVNAAHAIADATAAGRPRGVITISVRRLGDAVEVRVADTGTGIPLAARAHMFAPFFTTKAVGKGTGQGLYQAHGVIVKKHGGTITFDTELGRGTVFIITLPLL